jgi:hypothetical protein
VKILLAPDVYVNASVAGTGLAPEQVVNRVLGNKKERHKTTEWVLTRVEAMLKAHPTFKKEAIEPQMKLIRDLVDIVALKKEPGEVWTDALVASAKAAGVKRVVTDHPDLADKTEVEGIEFLSSDAWMIEQQTPPPPPPPPKAGAKKDAPKKDAAPKKK